MDKFNYATCVQKPTDCTQVAMNADGDMLSTALSNGHVTDIKMVEDLIKGFKTTVYADRGYLSQILKEKLRSYKALT